jgi:hypothetical protein
MDLSPSRALNYQGLEAFCTMEVSQNMSEAFFLQDHQSNDVLMISTILHVMLFPVSRKMLVDLKFFNLITSRSFGFC